MMIELNMDHPALESVTNSSVIVNTTLQVDSVHLQFSEVLCCSSPLWFERIAASASTSGARAEMCQEQLY